MLTAQLTYKILVHRRRTLEIPVSGGLVLRWFRLGAVEGVLVALPNVWDRLDMVGIGIGRTSNCC
jgi:hypothetical protein